MAPKEVRVSVRMPKSLRDGAVKAAQALGSTLNEWIREAMRMRLEAGRGKS